MISRARLHSALGMPWTLPTVREVVAAGLIVLAVTTWCLVVFRAGQWTRDSELLRAWSDAAYCWGETGRVLEAAERAAVVTTSAHELLAEVTQYRALLTGIDHTAMEGS